METLVLMRIQGKRLAFPVRVVSRVIWAIKVTPMPGQDAKFKGVINVEEEVIPVVNLNYILGAPDAEIELDNDIVIVQTHVGQLAIIADCVEGVEDYPEADFAPANTNMESFAGAVLKSDSGMMVILDPTKLIQEEDIAVFKSLMAKVLVAS